jgi:hypothetical protein
LQLLQPVKDGLGLKTSGIYSIPESEGRIKELYIDTSSFIT